MEQSRLYPPVIVPPWSELAKMTPAPKHVDHAPDDPTLIEGEDFKAEPGIRPEERPDWVTQPPIRVRQFLEQSRAVGRVAMNPNQSPPGELML